MSTLATQFCNQHPNLSQVESYDFALQKSEFSYCSFNLKHILQEYDKFKFELGEKLSGAVGKIEKIKLENEKIEPYYVFAKFNEDSPSIVFTVPGNELTITVGRPEKDLEYTQNIDSNLAPVFSINKSNSITFTDSKTSFSLYAKTKSELSDVELKMID